jgi:hypothetical protein
MLKLVYVGQPYSHPDKEVVNDRVTAVARYMADRIGCKDGFVYYSPICHGQTIHLNAGVGNDYTCWENHSLAMLALASELHVLCLDGWEKSVGLCDEISFASHTGMPIRYFDQDHFNPYKFHEA